MTTQETLETVYDPTTVEPQMYELWEACGAFRSQPADTPHDKTFTIVIPPPNVTGALHLGHALNNTLQDILVRYHRMCGFNTLWQPGTDHAGIATQAVVERRIRETEGMTRHELGATPQEAREELVRRIWEWKKEYEQRILSQLKLMGCSCDWGYRKVDGDESRYECDWHRTRFTLDDGLCKAVREMFFKLFKDGLIFRGKRLVNWDTQLQTAVSDDEVYHEMVKGHFWHFKYPIIPSEPRTSVRADAPNATVPTNNEPKHVIIATTRPETMLGDTAVAVHPDPAGYFDKIETELNDQRAQASGKSSREADEIQTKLDALAQRRETHLDLLVTLAQMARDGRMLLLPLMNRKIPLITDEWANPMLGSGCVKITPAHDPNDYEVGVRHSLAMINVMTRDGKIAPIVEPDADAAPTKPDSAENADSDKYAGLTFAAEGRDKVVADLETLNLLHKVEDRETEKGHSDRSKIPIEPFLSDQWFVRTSEPPTSVGADVRCPKSDQRSADVSPCGRSDEIHRRTPDFSDGVVLITWTTYGTWLPGDERGFVSRVPSPESPHPKHNVPGQRYDADDPQARASAMERLEGRAVYLDPHHAKVALAAIAGVSGRHGIEPIAVAIMANHIHVLCQTQRTKDELLKLYKGSVSHALNEQFKLDEAPRWFTKGGSVRYSKSKKDVTAAVEYVKKQEHPLILWSFDVGDPLFASALESADQDSASVSSRRESAPTEVGGSLGLAQLAMDAVTDGRIQVFPSRYGKSYLDWLGEKRDWCISRQLWWGHRLLVWTRKYPLSGVTAGPPSGSATLDDLETPHFRPAHRGLFIPGGSITKHATAHALSEDYICFLEDPSESDLVILQAWSYSQDEDVLDTWFSSALWPLSTLGWPDDTPHVRQYYPGSVLCTGRDIITNWVARMVMFGLYATGEVPFDHVYIHPKILDGRGETMSKSKGNGVDPVDIIHTNGADALRYTMADMCTETQDIRMPVDYICPHCEKRTDQQLAVKAEEQRRKSRGEKLTRKIQPADCHRVKCVHKECGKEFATKWSEQSLKDELGVARETSEKFEQGRNFCNKLWNAARFAFMNLEGAPCEKLDIAALPPEDRWILARLSQTARRYHEYIKNYQFSASIRELRVFFWESLCDWYIELTKPRLSTDNRARSASDGSSEPPTSAGADTQVPSDVTIASRATAQQVLAFCLDQTLRMMHPTIPFITERLWQQLNRIVPRRGLPGVAELTTDGPLILAAFPPRDGYAALEDESVLKTFADLQDATRGVREVRTRCKVSPKDAVTVTVVVAEENFSAFKENAHILQHMASIASLEVVADATRPKNSGSVTIGGLRIFVHDISDDDDDRRQTEKSLGRADKQISGKEAKLGNEKFIANAKPEIVDAERQRLKVLITQRDALHAHLAELNG